jgi:hypothetical protein
MPEDEINGKVTSEETLAEAQVISGETPIQVPHDPLYLGDGAYVCFDQWHVILTTGHHDPQLADNAIYIEYASWNILAAYVAKVGSRG